MIQMWKIKPITNRQFMYLLRYYTWLHIISRTLCNRYIASCVIRRIEESNYTVVPLNIDEEKALMEGW